MNCQFCGAEENPFSYRPAYSCGTLVVSLDPDTLVCWRGYYNKATLKLSECERQLSRQANRLERAMQGLEWLYNFANIGNPPKTVQGKRIKALIKEWEKHGKH